MTGMGKDHCVLCNHELIMCGDCAEKVCSHPIVSNAVCECDAAAADAKSNIHYLFRFKGATPESLAKALLRPRPKGNTQGVQSEAG